MKASPKGINSPDTPDTSAGMKTPWPTIMNTTSQPSGQKFVLHCFLQERPRDWSVVSSPQQFSFAANKAALKLSENWLETL